MVTQRVTAAEFLLPKLMLTAHPAPIGFCSLRAAVVKTGTMGCGRDRKGWEEAKPLASTAYWIPPPCRGEVRLQTMGKV